MAPSAWIELEYRSEGVTHCHNTRPGHEGVNDKELALPPDVKQGRLVQKIPEPTEVIEMLGADTIEQVVPSDHNERRPSPRSLF